MQARYILNFFEIDHSDHARVGGKCASLGAMTQAGIAVPPGFAVTTDAYCRMIDHHGLGPEIARRLAEIDPDDLDTVERSAREIRAMICSLPLPAEIEDDLRSAYHRMGSDLPVAVRSSATAEDLPDASFAGQQDTYLWVVGADAVVEKVRDCWASLFTSRAIAYRTKNRIGHMDVQMSVAVQKMVNARTAGVAMTLDPANGDRTRIVIDASWGLGETVVSGLVTPDNFKVDAGPRPQDRRQAHRDRRQCSRGRSA